MTARATIHAATLRPGRTVRWAAEADGVAHAHERGAVTTVCGRKPTDERFAWPAHWRCLACLIARDEIV